ncbi:hypothetical protein [Helicobacter pylori]|nr:hypothetical protein [Helicobacter pylori]
MFERFLRGYRLLFDGFLLLITKDTLNIFRFKRQKPPKKTF